MLFITIILMDDL